MNRDDTMVWPWSAALVTGASSGVGEAMTRLLAAGGVDVVMVARSAERLHAIARELDAAGGGRCEVLVADLGIGDGLDAVVRRLEDADRPVDLVVNNAAAAHAGPFLSVPADLSERDIRLGVTAVVRLTHAALDAMGRRGSGRVLNISSTAGFAPAPGLAVYAAAKAFVTNFSLALQDELRGRPVGVTVVCPGKTVSAFHARAGLTEMIEDLERDGRSWQQADDAARGALQAAAAGLPMQVVAVPEERAHAGDLRLALAVEAAKASLVADTRDARRRCATVARWPGAPLATRAKAAAGVVAPRLAGRLLVRR